MWICDRGIRHKATIGKYTYLELEGKVDVLAYISGVSTTLTHLDYLDPSEKFTSLLLILLFNGMVQMLKFHPISQHLDGYKMQNTSLKGIHFYKNEWFEAVIQAHMSVLEMLNNKLMLPNHNTFLPRKMYSTTFWEHGHTTKPAKETFRVWEASCSRTK